ncbi:ABC transporter permease subunit [Arthrobacter gengyunqii]|uniref:ABC transporter permease subunit n=1 Tax=Arthrobacter gengyunqii TaxID=2886940 RepID=A0A9X1LYW8_9MICC|nr:ABC transporter permease subunit [Arthrobacter gengyunqii]MCC3267785.1 ABC transporter permease subunit [Arthrobacter gengyunqii]UOY95217.1 ABC transporter permease subunit [Arthrobacter gengyunqii]
MSAGRARFPLPPWAIGLGGVVLVIGLWWIGALTFLSGIGAAPDGGGGSIPTPLAIVQQFGADGFDYYQRNASVTIIEAVTGYFWGNLIALALAGAVMVFPLLERLVSQLGVISYCLPVVAIGPIIFIIMGPPATGEASGTAVALAALSVFFTTLVGSIMGFKTADQSSLDIVTVYGGRRIHQLVKVQAIAAIPGVLNSLKIAAPAAFLGAVLGEYVGGVDRGLGPAMVNAQQSLEIERVWGVALVCGLLAGAGYLLFALISRYATPWSAGSASAEGGRR